MNTLTVLLVPDNHISKELHIWRTFKSERCLYIICPSTLPTSGNTEFSFNDPLLAWPHSFIDLVKAAAKKWVPAWISNHVKCMKLKISRLKLLLANYQWWQLLTVVQYSQVHQSHFSSWSFWVFLQFHWYKPAVGCSPFLWLQWPLFGLAEELSTIFRKMIC